MTLQEKYLTLKARTKAFLGVVYNGERINLGTAGTVEKVVKKATKNDPVEVKEVYRAATEEDFETIRKLGSKIFLLIPKSGDVKESTASIALKKQAAENEAEAKRLATERKKLEAEKAKLKNS